MNDEARAAPPREMINGDREAEKGEPHGVTRGGRRGLVPETEGRACGSAVSLKVGEHEPLVTLC